jgi:D-alanyl-D-alanine carboxypeptidase
MMTDSNLSDVSIYVTHNKNKLMKNLKFFFVIISFSAFIYSCSDDKDIEIPVIQQEDISQIDTKMNALMDEFNYPGLSMAVAKNGKLVYAKGYGIADKQSGAAVNTQNIFRYSSFAKTITGIAVLKLVDEGKISLDSKVFGEGAILGTTFGSRAYSNRVRAITVDHLLHHLPGGWRNFNDDPVFDGPVNISAEELISWGLDNVALATNPGTTYHYSNFGYLILGRVIEAASGKSYGQYVKEAILDPVGANSTFLAGNSLNDRRPNEVIYYSQDNLDPYSTYNIARGDATAGWVSTPSDIARILSAIDEQPGRPVILNPQLNELRRTPLSNSGNYGKGVYRLNHPDLGPAYWHDGLWPGTQSLSISLKGNMCVSLVMNSGVYQNYNQSLNKIAGIIFEIMTDETIEYQDIDQF